MSAPNALEKDYRPGLIEGRSHQFVVISGCSGAGKSTLLAELAKRGYAVFEEPGRQIVKEQLYIGGGGVPWGDTRRFIELCVSRAMHQMVEAARHDRLSFFYRGIVDAVSNLEHLKLPVPEAFKTALKKCRYHERMFMTPPWPEIFANDGERRHNFADAVAEFEMLAKAYARLGYEVVMVPKLAPGARAEFVLERVAGGAV